MDAASLKSTHPALAPFILNGPLFQCPLCSGEISFSSQAAVCRSCAHSFGFEQGIPLFFAPNQWDGKTDVTEAMKSFYEQTPFPNYEEIDSKFRLIEKAEKGLFANLLNKQIPFGAKVLEAGCGTGQLSNYLGIAPSRMVFGADMCLNSLKLAQGFKTKNNIENAAFLQMNLFRPVFKPESFDIVISNGVLHHTSDPYGAFKSILRLVKRRGFIIIGLYNTYGRIPTDVRRLLFRFTGSLFNFLDPHLRKNLGSAKKRAWFMDQYRNPHESKHSMDEVLKWFDQNGVDFMNGVPKLSPLRPFGENEALFKPCPRESRVERILAQCGLALQAAHEGGLFIMIGQKK